MKTKTMWELFRTWEEDEENIEIEVVFIHCPNGDNWQYIYDEEYSFRGYEEDYKEWIKDYFDYGDIDEDFISYRNRNIKVVGEPDISVLYLKDW